MIEIWRPIVYPGSKYEISSLGRVRSFTSYTKGKTLNPSIDSRGYINFSIRSNHKPKTLYIHREMAKAFKENPNNYKIVRHLNDIKTDNRLDNIEWGTSTDNRADAIRNGKQFHAPGKKPIKAKLTKDLVLAIIASSANNSELGRTLGVTECTVSKVRTGRTWNNITKVTDKKFKQYRKAKSI